MEGFNTDRRRFLKLMIYLPVALAVGGDTELFRAHPLAASVSPEESLRKLIFLVGPWSPPDRDNAEDFAGRFLKAGHLTGSYLPDLGEAVQSLASRFPDNTMAVKKIDLQDLPPVERELLVNLVKQLYSLIEVRFYVLNEPPWGECQPHIKLPHTRPPRPSRT